MRAPRLRAQRLQVDDGRDGGPEKALWNRTHRVQSLYDGGLKFPLEGHTGLGFPGGQCVSGNGSEIGPIGSGSAPGNGMRCKSCLPTGALLAISGQWESLDGWRAGQTAALGLRHVPPSVD